MVKDSVVSTFKNILTTIPLNSLGSQIVIEKLSDSNSVYKLYSNSEEEIENRLLNFESEHLFVHSNLSISGAALKAHKAFKNANLVHYHMVHNTHLPLYSLIELCNKKPSVISIHDPWFFTGRCVHFDQCDGWKTGCKKCSNLNTLFTLKKDNCKYLWDLKKLVYENIDPDIIVHSPYILNLVKESPLTKHFKNVHLVPFGIDINFFDKKFSKEEACKKLGINPKNTIIFFRAQKQKGTDYIKEALLSLEKKDNITILTCDQEGYFTSLNKDFTVKDLGSINSETLLYAYNACDMFLMPSLGESFGLMAVEAMSCHKPVIIFDNTALPSVTFAPDCGILVENKNSQKLMEAIKMLIENPSEGIKRGELGRKLAKEHYDLNNYNKKLLEIYHLALTRKHSKAKKVFLDNSIDKNDIETVKISKKLNILTKKLFVNVPIINPKNKKAVKNKNIDYSNINVQKTLRNYTDVLYNSILKNTSTQVRPKISFHEFKWLLKNDRPKLKTTIMDILSTKPFLYNCTKILYKTIKFAKHTYEKNKEIINYLIVGGLTTVISLAVYYLSVFTFLNPNNSIELQIANILSWIAGVTFAYFTNRKFVFESKNTNKIKEATKFVSSRITTLLLDMFVMWLGVTILHFSDKIIKIISQILITIGNYILSKLFVFKKDSKEIKNG